MACAPRSSVGPLAAFVVAAVFVGAGCDGEGGHADAGPPADFPADYATTYTQVRECRLSIEHDQKNVRVMASPDAVTPYLDRLAPFPAGSVVVKEEYAEGDDRCTGSIVNFTVMIRLTEGSDPASLDWKWQAADSLRQVRNVDLMKCTRCHAMCPDQGVGYMGTCEEP